MSETTVTIAALRHEKWLILARHASVRLAGGLLVLWVIATLTFFAMRQMPGDPALAILGGGTPTAETIAAVTHEYGLDKPLSVQYGIYLVHLLQGELGVSYTQRLPVIEIISQQGGATLQLVVAALIIAWFLVLLWTLPTAGRRRWLSGLGSLVETVAAALPQFWLGILLLAVFAFGWRLFPAAGSEGLRTIVLPAFALAVPLAGFIGQVTRESLEVNLEQPFVLSARMRGVGDWTIRYRHLLRHSVLSGISLSGWAIGALISGAVVVEVIFSRKGLGRQLFQAVQAQDVPLVVGITLVVAVGYVIANFLVDLLYNLVDPRLQGNGQ